MRRQGKGSYASMVLVFVLATATASYAADNQIGVWKVNAARSTFGSGPAPKSFTTRNEAVEGGIRTVADREESDGRKAHYEYTVKYDGKDYPVTGDPDRDMVAFRKIDDYTFEMTTGKGGKVMTTSRIVYSRDGKSRTITTTGINAQGQTVSATTVWDKN